MVHQYQLNGYNIVLDSCSGSIHVVDEVAYDIIALFETHTPEEIVGRHAGEVRRPPGCNGGRCAGLHSGRAGPKGRREAL